MYKITLNTNAEKKQKQNIEVLAPGKQNKLDYPLNVYALDEDQSEEPTIRSAKSAINSMPLVSPHHLSHEIKDKPDSLSDRAQLSAIRNEYHDLLQENKKAAIKKLDEKVRHYKQLFDLEKIVVNYQSKGVIFRRILKPDNKCLQVWNFVNSLFILIWSFYLPLIIGFKMNHDYSCFYFAIKVLDIVFQLRTSIVSNGIIITCHNQIIRNYIEKYLLRDILIISCQSALIQLTDVHIKWILLMVALFCQYKRIRYQWIQIYIQTNLHHYQLTLLIFYFVFIMHFLTCFWNNYLELQLEFIDNSSIIQQYLNTYYYVIIMMTFNANYQPQSEITILLYICTLIFSIFSFSLLITFLINGQHSKYTDISIYSKTHNLNMNLIAQLLSQYEEKQQIQQQDLSINISSQLTQQINYNYRSKILQNYFHNYQQQAIDSITEQCEEIFTYPNQVILQQNQVDDSSLYFIIEGTFNVQSKNSDNYGKLTKNQTFGELSFYTQQQRTATVVSDKHGRLLKIKRESCLKCLSYIDKQRFQQTRDEILYNNILPIKCFCCNKDSHVLVDCPMLSYKPKIMQVIGPLNQVQYRNKNTSSKRRLRKLKTAYSLENTSVAQDLLELYKEQNDSESEELPSQTKLDYYSVSQPLSVNTDQISLSQGTSSQSRRFSSPRPLFSGLPQIEQQKIHQMSQLSSSCLQNQKFSKYDPECKMSMQMLPELPSDGSSINKTSFSTFRILSESEKTINYEIVGFESLYRYDLYYPQYNFDKTIEELNKQREYNIKSSTTVQINIAQEDKDSQ